MIDVAHIESIPIEIKNKIFCAFESLSQETITHISDIKIEYLNDVACAIEDKFSPFSNVLFYNQLTNLLEKYEIVCFHSTKMLSKNNVQDKGLAVNEWDIYKYNLEKVYRTAGYTQDVIDKVLTIVNREYKRKYSDLRNGAQLCFFSNLSMLEGEYASYDQFCENIGGELARWALKKQYPDLYKPLKELGESFIVKFKIPFGKIVWFEKDTIAYQFVKYYAGIYFWNKFFEIEFDGNTQCNIPPEDILEIIPYDKDIDY